jgi:hypothetical protein
LREEAGWLLTLPERRLKSLAQQSSGVTEDSVAKKSRTQIHRLIYIIKVVCIKPLVNDRAREKCATLENDELRGD